MILQRVFPERSFERLTNDLRSVRAKAARTFPMSGQARPELQGKAPHEVAEDFDVRAAHT